MKAREVYKYNEKIVYIEDWMKGQGLTQFCKVMHQSLDEDSCKYVAFIVASALADMHRQGYIHRDLKTDCVLCKPDGSIKVGGTGLVTYLASDKLYEKARLGTTFFMAPEIINGAMYNQGVDQWSFGCFLFEIAFGKPSFATGGRHEGDSSDDEEESLTVIYDRIRNQKVQGAQHRNHDFNDIMLTQLSKDSNNRMPMQEVLNHPYFKGWEKNLARWKESWKRDYRIFEGRRVYNDRNNIGL